MFLDTLWLILEPRGIVTRVRRLDWSYGDIARKSTFQDHCGKFSEGFSDLDTQPPAGFQLWKFCRRLFFDVSMSTYSSILMLYAIG